MTAGETLWLNIIGGIIAAIAYSTILLFNKYFRKRKFKYLLGMDADKESIFNLVYAKLKLPDIFDGDGKSISHPYIKPNYRGNERQYNFSMEFPVSSCEVRALKYLTSSLLNLISAKTKLVSDVDDSINSKLNMSFISLGGMASNYKTEDLLTNKANKFLTMDADNFISKNGKKLLNQIEPGYDYGLIIRLRPVEFKNRVWIVCAGIGEWGTSGSAWFLSYKFGELLKKIKRQYNIFYWGSGKDFAAIIKVKKDQDESASLIAVFKNEKEINEYIKTNVIEENVQDKSNSSLKYETPATSSVAPHIEDHKISDYPSHIGSSGFRIDINKMSGGKGETDLNE